MEYFKTLGDNILSAWAQKHYDHQAFPAIAQHALSDFDLSAIT
ncbi:MAG: hypothetical protein QGI45_13990 [Myxococcota bacterium]|nr:hypothetical protein [Myxococcota bacterium]